MKNNQFPIWIGDKDLNHDQDFIKHAGQEFAPVTVSQMLDEQQNGHYQANRRDFLKFFGFSLGAATIAAACETPVRKAVPYLVKPDTIVPGIATYYASSYVQGGDYCAVLVKTRDGRPVKLEGNDLSAVTKGGTSARAQASVLSLYDVNRLKGPAKVTDGALKEITWADLDKEISGALRADSQVRLVTNTIMSPSLKAAIAQFQAKFPNTRVVTYDAVSSAGLLIANERNFGLKMLPAYHFDKAETIVSIGADFLGTWVSPVEYAADYAKMRKVANGAKKMSRHYQVESYMSLSGSNADNRVQIKPSETGAAIATLYNLISDGSKVTTPALNEHASKALEKIASELKAAGGRSLVVSGSNNLDEQVLINQINVSLGNYGRTITFDHASYQRQGDERDVETLITEMGAGSIQAVIVLGANPAYELPNATRFAEALTKVPLRISLNSHADETAHLCHWVAPDHHYLESWGDAQPQIGRYSLIQPTISPLFNTRQAGHSLLVWSDSTELVKDAEQPYLEFVKKVWTNMFAMQTRISSFQAFWDASLQNGVFETGGQPEPGYQMVDASGLKVTQPGSGQELTLFESIPMGAGQFANNPWLMEMPDPVNRCSWGNYLGIPVSFDGYKNINGYNNLEDGDLVNVTAAQGSVKVPVVKQFGLAEGTFSLPIGYGRTKAGRCGNNIGANVQGWISLENGLFQYYQTNVEVSAKVGEEKDFSCVQYHHTMGVKATDTKSGEQINADEADLVFFPLFNIRGYQGALTDRTIIRGGHLKDLEHFTEELKHEREHHQHLNEQTLYPDYSNVYTSGHRWGMHVDLNACIGCGACTVACMAENNVPVVGKHNVARHQEMTWLRIDRYYYGDLDNPRTVYQPMMCQHCQNAPCENVCPVNATNHSSEGLNQMAYNRCIGTRYCANNCPFKVRRLNWADYMTADLFPINEVQLNEEEIAFYADNLTRMVLNPDVTVRSRGVMEKCSFCVQRLQEGKLTAKLAGRKLEDRDVRTACQTACPTGAITFGDVNNPNSEVSKSLTSPLNYIVLEETNVGSSVNYSAKINNANEELFS